MNQLVEKIDAVANGSATEAKIHVTPKTSEDWKSDRGLAEAENNTSTSDQKRENEGRLVQNAAKMHQEEETAAVRGSDKFKLAYHRQVLGGLVEEMKKPRKSTNLVTAAGFTKQQLRIQAATGDRKLKITGKSRQGDNILIRFNKELTVSSDYDLDQIRAKFEGGVLYIKHPKKNISPAMPVQENNASSTTEPQKPANEKPEDETSGQD
ncbi:hypothetical protein POTOM_016186 [Populus tomentosa]|uniref:SHSP domain-containing protein n=1 Tax=Populus tomentosa TaxID=118781 RepID=A0A8X8A387_POPTO|nr:hypothetical protein POTOM_016186 [Populus tomentosa]